MSLNAYLLSSILTRLSCLLMTCYCEGESLCGESDMLIMELGFILSATFLFGPYFLSFSLQEEYVIGETIGTLDCGHDFHTDCVKQWLVQKNLCPICKMTGLGT